MTEAYDGRQVIVCERSDVLEAAGAEALAGESGPGVEACQGQCGHAARVCQCRHPHASHQHYRSG